MSGPSADEIAAMREQAEREHEPPAAKPKKKKKKKKRDRVTVETLPDGGLLTIAPSVGWRDPASWVVLLALAVCFGVSFGGALGQATGALMGFVSVVALGHLLFASVPTWHVRWTQGGDVIVYKRRPRRPKWVGRCGALTIETSITTRKKKFIGWLKFSPTNGEKHFYPLTADDVHRMRKAADDAGFGRKHTGW